MASNRPIGQPLTTEADGKWMLPRRVEPFLALLAKTPTLGDSDRARVRRFAALPQADSMPKPLRQELTDRGLL